MQFVSETSHKFKRSCLWAVIGGFRSVFAYHINHHGRTRKGIASFLLAVYTLNLHAYAVSFPTRPDDTPTTLTMSKIVINNCVMKGYHAYEPVVNVGDTYECQPEINNIYDNNAVSVHSALSEVIGHVPINLCDYLRSLFACLPGKLVILG